MLHDVPIPPFVLAALHDVEEQLPCDCYEPETVITFVKLFEYDDAYRWLIGHRDLYFEALSRADLPALLRHP